MNDRKITAIPFYELQPALLSTWKTSDGMGHKGKENDSGGILLCQEHCFFEDCCLKSKSRCHVVCIGQERPRKNGLVWCHHRQASSFHRGSRLVAADSYKGVSGNTVKVCKCSHEAVDYACLLEA